MSIETALTTQERRQFENLIDLLNTDPDDQSYAIMRCTLDGEDVAVVIHTVLDEEGVNVYPVAVLITPESDLFSRIAPPEGGEVIVVAPTD